MSFNTLLLRNIKTKTIVKALVKFFIFVGLPRSVQSDQGSNFMSGIFQQVMHELGIKQYKSSAYHPESQGALERFHQTMKIMTRSFCFDMEKDLDEGIYLLLFAVRESVQESLRFSPFELVFGHTVRGPLKLLKETFQSDDDSSLNLLQYVSVFKNRLSKACEAALGCFIFWTFSLITYIIKPTVLWYKQYIQTKFQLNLSMFEPPPTWMNF